MGPFSLSLDEYVLEDLLYLQLLNHTTFRPHHHLNTIQADPVAFVVTGGTSESPVKLAVNS